MENAADRAVSDKSRESAIYRVALLGTLHANFYFLELISLQASVVQSPRCRKLTPRAFVSFRTDSATPPS